MFVRVRVPAPTPAERGRRIRVCWFSLSVVGMTLGVLWVALFDIDPTPHLPPDSSVGLTVGVMIALTAQLTALIVCYRDQCKAHRRRLERETGADVVFDSALPLRRVS